MLLYRPKQKISATASEEVKLPASSIDGLAAVATSGSYNDLTDKPTFPTDYVTINTDQEITGKKTFKHKDGIFIDRIHNLSGNAVYDYDGTNVRFGSVAKPAHIRGSETRPKYESPSGDGSGSTVKKDIALVDDLSNYVKYTAQTLTDAQKSQARSNIGAGTSDFSGSYNDLSDKPTNLVTTDTEQNITGKKTVVSPSNTDDSTQIANTSWVRENYQATCYAGRDSNETGTMYFKVASYTTVANYDHVSLIANLQDIDTPITAQVVVRCTTPTSAYKPTAYIGVPTASCADISYARHYAERLFIVANYTIGTASWTFELWLKTTGAYEQTIFNVVSQNSRKGNHRKRPWTLYNNITTASGTTDFSEESSDGRLVANDKYPYAVIANYLQPHKDNVIDLGGSSAYWSNGYIRNLQGCKVINGGGGNSMIQQDSDTAGADILVGSTGCPLKLQGKEVRPVYRQRTGSYSNIALQSDIPTIPPIPFDSTGLSTGTLGATTKLAEGRYYIERDVELNNHKTHISAVVDGTDNYVYIPVRTSTAMNFISIVLGSSATNLVSVLMALHDSSGAIVDNTAVSTGTFKYKKID